MAHTLTRRDVLFDWAIAIALLAFAALTIFIGHDLDPETAAQVQVQPWAEYALAAAVMLPLAWRRRYPLTVLVVVGAAFLAFRYAGVYEGTMSSIALFLALFTAGAQSQHPARDWVRGGVVAASMVVVVSALLRQQEYVGLDMLIFSSYSIMANVAYFVAGWLLGDARRTRQRYERELSSGRSSSPPSGRTARAGRSSTSASASRGSCTTWWPTT
jgi:hypothetical protein